jgi:hypothetical protein
MDHTEIVCEGVSWILLAEDTVQLRGFCKHSDEPSDPTNSLYILLFDKLSDY